MKGKPNYTTYANYDQYQSDLIIWQDKRIKELEAEIKKILDLIIENHCDQGFFCNRSVFSGDNKHRSLFVKQREEPSKTKEFTARGVALPEVEAGQLDIPADRVLEAAIGTLEEVVIVGIHQDGSEYFASSVADGPNVNWMLDRAKKALVEIIDNQ